jgi:hypothetical protein
VVEIYYREEQGRTDQLLRHHSVRSSNRYTVKKVFDFPVPSRDVTYLTLRAGNNSIIPDQGEFG